MSDRELADIARRDQIEQAVIEHARRVAAFYRTLLAEGVPQAETLHLTITFLDNDETRLDAEEVADGEV